MAGFNDPTYSYVGQPANGADLDTYVIENMQWVVHHASNPAPIFATRLSTPVALTTGTFVPIPADTTIMSRGGALVGGIFTAPLNGTYAFSCAVSITDTLGNKELRLGINGDENDWIGADNAYGAGSSAPARRTTSCEAWPLVAGDTVSPMVFTDAPTPGSVDGMVFCARWVGV